MRGQRVNRPTSAVKNPCLRIMGGAGNLPVWGYCSVCENVKFAPTHELTDPNQQQQWLKYLFNRHFAKVHLHEDGTQACQQKAIGDKRSTCSVKGRSIVRAAGIFPAADRTYSNPPHLL